MPGRVRNLSRFLLLALIVVLISLYVVSRFAQFRQADMVQAPAGESGSLPGGGLGQGPEAGASGGAPGEALAGEEAASEGMPGAPGAADGPGALQGAGGPVAPALAPSGPAAAAAPPSSPGGGLSAPLPAGAAASMPEGPGLVVPFGPETSASATGELEGLAFMDYRLERERSRGQEAEWLRDLSQDPEADPATRAEAGRRLLELATRGAKEAELESLIRAKGFEDALVFLFSGSAVVLVKASQLTQGEVARIGEVVSRGAGLKLEDISIMCRPR
ncbi:MAG: SpoIIIAH-like family protein [Acetobacteraceae bacterium]|nr:SpoIIIAH-like family protein [Acetobacteraceae bacterium]